MGVEDLLQKHSLLEADINVVGERVKSVNSQAGKFVETEGDEAAGKAICQHTCAKLHLQGTVRTSDTYVIS